MSIQRIALQGWKSTDFAKMRPGSLLLSPILPDAEVKTQGGLYLPGQEIEKIPGTAALCYRVVKVSDDIDDVAVDDIVVVRNAMLDPIDTTLTLCLVDAKHVLLRVRPEALEPEPDEAPAPAPMASTLDVTPPLTLDQLAERFRARTAAPVCEVPSCDHPVDAHTAAGRCVVDGCKCGEPRADKPEAA